MATIAFKYSIYKALFFVCGDRKEMLQKQDGRGDGPKDTPEIEALEELWEATRGRQIEAAKASAGRGKSKPRIRDICEGAEKMLARVAGNSTPTTEILVLESRVKEALIKERVHNKILSWTLHMGMYRAEPKISL